MPTKSFKERVKDIAIQEAKNYKNIFVNYDYLVCAKDLVKHFYIISSEEFNYLHLVGVGTNLSAQNFYDKCYNGKLEESDFNFIKFRKSEASVKGSVREKILVLPLMHSIFSSLFWVQEKMAKNKMSFDFSFAENQFTLGFITNGVEGQQYETSRPQTLLKKNQLDMTKAVEVELVLRRKRGTEKFDTIILGELKDLMYHQSEVHDLLNDNLLHDLSDYISLDKAGQEAAVTIEE